ncbi:MAG TPA: hypothetical protein VF026_12885 [Ktedonobacteraceae bacterium]
MAFSEDMPSSYQTFGEKHPLGQQSSRHCKLSCEVLPPPGTALPARDPTLFVTLSASFASGETAAEMLSAAKHDSRTPRSSPLAGQVISPNVWNMECL